MNTKKTLLALLVSASLAGCGSEGPSTRNQPNPDGNQFNGDVVGAVQTFQSEKSPTLNFAVDKSDKLQEITFQNNDFAMQKAFEGLLTIKFEVDLFPSTLSLIDEFTQEPGDEFVFECPRGGTEAITTFDGSTKDVAEKDDALKLSYANCQFETILANGDLGVRLFERSNDKISLIERLSNFSDAAFDRVFTDQGRIDKTLFQNGSIFIKSYDNFNETESFGGKTSLLNKEIEATSTPASGGNTDISHEAIFHGSVFDFDDTVREVGFVLRANGQDTNKVRFTSEGAPFAGTTTAIGKNGSQLQFTFQPNRVLVTFTPVNGTPRACLFNQADILTRDARFNQDGSCFNTVDPDQPPPPPTEENPVVEFLNNIRSPIDNLQNTLGGSIPLPIPTDLPTPGGSQNPIEGIINQIPLPLNQIN